MKIYRFLMESDTSQSAGMIKFIAWLEVNRKRLLWIAGAILAVVIIIVVLAQLQKQREISASHALSEIKVSGGSSTELSADTTEALLKVAQDYRGTKAAARALLRYATAIFEEGKYADAETRFEEFLQLYPESPWAPQAAFGIAAALDAQDKTAEAINKYEDFGRRYPTDPTHDEARLALARLYEKSNRHEEAFKIYDELSKSTAGTGLSAEAGMRREELVARFPELAKTNAPAVAELAPAVTLMTNAPAVLITNQAPTTNAVPVPGANPIQIQVTPEQGAAPAPKP